MVVRFDRLIEFATKCVKGSWQSSHRSNLLETSENDIEGDVCPTAKQA